MILTSFEYKETGWELKDLAPLKPVNLFVGRNATGKTRSIRAIRNVAQFLQNNDFKTDKSFETELKFGSKEDKSWTMTYSFKITKDVVEKESLVVNGDILINRTKLTAKYKNTSVDPPSDKLIVQVRRDKSLYPDIEKLMEWAEGVVMVSCSGISNSLGIAEIASRYSFSNLVDSLSEGEKKKVKSLAKTLGYNIADINVIEIGRDFRLVQIKENLVLLADTQLSNGMFRTLYLLCFIFFIKHDKKLSLLLIDDLGEGLDYRRSVDLGKMIFNDCKEYGLQLIASSNDAFLMDVVDIADWQVLSRNNGKVTSINSKNNPDLFRKFRMTGLSNFDFFSSDFIDNYLNEQQK